MTIIRLPFIHGPFRARGRLYCYFRKRGCARVRLPGLPGSAEFMAAYQAALAGMPPMVIGASRTVPGTFDALIADYYDSAIHFREPLKPATQRHRRNILEKFRARHGRDSVKLFQRKHVIPMAELIERPHARKAWLMAMRGLMKYAIARGWIAEDPTIGIKLARPPKSGGHRTWGEAEIAVFRERNPLGSRARLALELLLNTGQRRGDMVRMGRQHVLHDGKRDKIQVRQEKTGAELRIPIHPDLAAAIEAAPSGHLTYLTTSFGKPFTPAGFTNWFRDRCDEAGLRGFSAHGLRKAVSRRLAEAGCSTHQIMAITGHKTLIEVTRYTEAAEQEALAEAAMAKI